MDIKIAGLSRDVLAQALEQAREGRIFILDKMLETLGQPRDRTCRSTRRASRTIKVKPDQIRLIIGPGGKTIKGIIDQTGVAIDVEDDGTVNVASSDSDAVKKALDIIKGLTTEPEVGADLQGHGAAHHRLRRVHRDPPGHRRPAPRLGDGAHARRAGRPT